MLSASAGRIAEQLWRYDEDETALWVLDCTDDELLRVSSVASWLVFNGPGTAKGSMMLAKACALAAVYVREGAPRELARENRRSALPATTPGAPSAAARRPPLAPISGPGKEYGVGDDLRRFYGLRTRDPGDDTRQRG